MDILLSRELHLTPSDHETLICLDFRTEKPYKALRILTDYHDAKMLDDMTQARRMIQRGIRKYLKGTDPSQWEQFLPVVNLVTLSLDFEGAFLGAAHRHPPKQALVISEGMSSPGFGRHKVSQGHWRAVVCVNALVSDLVCYRLVIQGVEESDPDPVEYRCMELHTHTVHSDGGASVSRLCHKAMDWEYDGIALTDHNTWSGVAELTPALESATLPVTHGIEWTTLYGHFLVIGDTRVDCRWIGQDDIHLYLERIQAEGCVVGVAHPCAEGAPFCSGCDWRFQLSRWDLVDYIEIWNGPFPLESSRNSCAFRRWTKLLNQGYRIAISSGRDWHLLGKEPQHPHLGVTYLGISGPIHTGTVQEALRAGRSYVTAGPTFEFAFQKEERAYGLGETISPGSCLLLVQVNEDSRRQCWQDFGIQTKQVRLIHNGEAILTKDCNGSAVLSDLVELSPGWTRLELYGDYREQTDVMLACSSPIYVE